MLYKCFMFTGLALFENLPTRRFTSQSVDEYHSVAGGLGVFLWCARWTGPTSEVVMSKPLSAGEWAQLQGASLQDCMASLDMLELFRLRCKMTGGMRILRIGHPAEKNGRPTPFRLISRVQMNDGFSWEQMQAAVTAYLKSKQLLLFAFAKSSAADLAATVCDKAFIWRRLNIERTSDKI